MHCRNCGRRDLELFEIVLGGERTVEVELCARCTREYEEIGWVKDKSPIEDTGASEDG